MFGELLFYMKLIPLGRGLFAKVDDEDYDFLMQWKWSAIPKSNGHYARRGSGRKTIRMQRLLMGLGAWKDDKRIIDHLDGDTLNNQKSNLRICTSLQNNQNSARRKHSSFPYKGVCRFSKNKCCSKIVVNKKQITLGVFSNTPEGILEAAKTYDEAAKRYFGEFAKLNFPTL